MVAFIAITQESIPIIWIKFLPTCSICFWGSAATEILVGRLSRPSLQSVLVCLQQKIEKPANHEKVAEWRVSLKELYLLVTRGDLWKKNEATNILWDAGRRPRDFGSARCTSQSIVELK